MATTAFAAVPEVLSHRGLVRADGVPFDGPGLFKFALVNAAGTTTYWSHDGSSVGGGQPASSISLPCAEGLYHVLLGDASIPNMTDPVAPGVFANSHVYLRVWFNDGVNGWQLLSPDQRVVSVGYALRAASVEEDAIGGAQITNESVSSADIDNGTIALADLNLASIDTRYVRKAGDTMTGSLTTPNLISTLVNTDDLITDAAILDIESGVDIEFKIDRNNSGSFGFFEVFNGANQHVFLVNENGGAHVFDDLTVDGTVYAREIINASGVFQLETGSDFEILLDRQGAATSYFEIFNGADNHVFWVNENGNARIYGDLTLDETLILQTPTQPGLFIYPSGTSNAEKPVIAHSPGYPNFGLWYNDVNDQFIAKSSATDTTPTIVIDVNSNWVGINTDDRAAGYELSVDGQIACEEVLVQSSGSWPDYVFEDDYSLRPLDQLESHIKQRKHLPGIPTAAEVEADGISVGAMQERMMEKIEELTLYVIEQNKRLAAQESRILELEAQVTASNALR